MNLQNLEYFIIVANEGNLTRAADTLGVTEQALSGCIQRLEKELGCTLFNRKPSFGLTYAGKCFLKTASDMLDIKKQGDTILHDITGNVRGELRVGISYTRGQAILPLVVPDFSKLYPNVELFLTELSTNELQDALDKGLVDVMIGFLPVLVDSAVVKPLLRDRLLLVLPRTLLIERFGGKADEVCETYRTEHDISVFRELPFVLLPQGERIRNHIDAKFAEKHVQPNIKIETHNVQTAFSLASEGIGITVCPEIYLKNKYIVPGLLNDEKLITLPLFSENVHDTIGIAYNRNRYLSSMAKDFIRICEEKLNINSI